MSLHNHALYQVATKALLFKNNKILILITPDNYIDFPGGRVDESERSIPWTDALKREIAEEIGDMVDIGIGRTLFVSKREYHKDGHTHHIAAIFFESHYLSGNVVISDEHSNFEWLTPEELIHDSRQYVSYDEKNQLVTILSQSTLQ